MLFTKEPTFSIFSFFKFHSGNTLARLTSMCILYGVTTSCYILYHIMSYIIDVMSDAKPVDKNKNLGL